jgi:hypothetical protein
LVILVVLVVEAKNASKTDPEGNFEEGEWGGCGMRNAEPIRSGGFGAGGLTADDSDIPDKSRQSSLLLIRGIRAIRGSLAGRRKRPHATTRGVSGASGPGHLYNCIKATVTNVQHVTITSPGASLTMPWHHPRCRGD